MFEVSGGIAGDTKIENTAAVLAIHEGNTSYYVDDSDGKTNNVDSDWIITKPYYVKLEKYISKAYNPDTYIAKFDETSRHYTTRSGNAEYGTSHGTAVSYPNNIPDPDKYNNPVTVETGDIVTYTIKVTNEDTTNTIKVTNEDTTKVNIGAIYDNLPEGVKLNKVTGKAYTNNDEENSDIGFSYNYFRSNNLVHIYTYNNSRSPYREDAILLDTNEYMLIKIEVEVTEPNISTRVLRNVAKIGEIYNKNDYEVYDSCTNDNEDADYIQLRDVEGIAGTVWNDKALNKTEDDYNGLQDDYKDDEGNLIEKKLKGIRVVLYRRSGSTYTKIAETTTNANGRYLFKFDNIKGPKVSGTNRWSGSYYTYRIQFWYDGITYTSTVQGDITAEDYTINSNASENGTSREIFNDKFSTINNQSEISYTTKNDDGYIPQSNHIYDEDRMTMSSDAYLNMGMDGLSEGHLAYINLGLRGRDIFDLELTSNVSKIDVTINGQPGTYNYTNKVQLRKSDLKSDTKTRVTMSSEVTAIEDGNTLKNEDSNTYVDGTSAIPKGEDGQQHKIRKTDGVALESIKVTYKITVQNASRTAGTATKIINYYDDKYDISTDKSKVAYYYKTEEDKEKDIKTWLKITVAKSGEGYKSIIIKTQGTNLTQPNSMDIYVEYSLNEDVLDELKNKIMLGNVMPTYNMSEIYEYQIADGQNEYTKGLIDKDSAPGSAATERVRLENGRTSTDTTVKYYFKATNLSDLKYEDDTYATPTLYFVSDSTVSGFRKLSGVVFRDNTTTNSETKIKTGNGVQDLYEDGKPKEGEEGVYGATVKLIELKETDYNETKLKAGGIVKIDEKYYPVRNTEETNLDGTYTFKNFLWGK